jgi:hypothetical protein
MAVLAIWRYVVYWRVTMCVPEDYLDLLKKISIEKNKPLEELIDALAYVFGVLQSLDCGCKIEIELPQPNPEIEKLVREFNGECSGDE